LYAFKDAIINRIVGFPGYIAIFVLSFIGACSVVVPIPYTAIIFILAGIRDLDLLIVALVGGLGSGLGEVTGWIVGRLMSQTLENTRYTRQVHALLKLAHAKGRYVLPLAIFMFALTPLPDDLLFIVLGILKYRLLHALIPCVLGKVAMLYLVSLFGKLTWKTASSVCASEELTMILTMVLLVVLLCALMIIRWDRMLEKYIEN